VLALVFPSVCTLILSSLFSPFFLFQRDILLAFDEISIAMMKLFAVRVSVGVSVCAV